MSLSIGIVGLPNVGKSTLFNALTRNEVLAANYPFATIDANVGVVAVPDPRLPRLAALYDSERVVPASVTFVDIAGIVRGASEGEGLGNQFLAAIRETDAVCQVVRAFEDDDVIHVEGRVHPADDIATVNTELVLADLQTVDNRLAKLLARGADALGAGRGPRRHRGGARASSTTGRPISAAAASGEIDPASPVRPPPAHGQAVHLRLQRRRGRPGDADRHRELAALVAPAESVVLCAQLEAELAALEPADAAEMLAEYGQLRSGLEQLVEVGFRTLGLHTFLTAGPKEARAWTIHLGDTAPEAAG